MIRVRLSTWDGRHVSDVRIPVFQKMPEVLMWGQRVFAHHQHMSIDGEPCRAEYREVFCYAIPAGGTIEEETPN